MLASEIVLTLTVVLCILISGQHTDTIVLTDVTTTSCTITVYDVGTCYTLTQGQWVGGSVDVE